jgi:hypothetical protein
MYGPAPMRDVGVYDALRHTTAGAANAEDNTGMCKLLHIAFKYPTNLVGFVNTSKIILPVAGPAGGRAGFLYSCKMLI